MNSGAKARLKVLGLGVGLFAGMMFSSTAMAQKDQPAPAEKAVAAEPLPKAEDILDRFVKETGGKEAYEQVKSIVMTGTIQVMMDMKGTLSLSVVRPGKMRSEVEFDQLGKIVSGSDGVTVWSENPMQGPRILEGDERELTLESSRISEEANWRERYTKVECVGVEDVNGKPAYKVVLTSKGSPRTAFYDKESGLLVKQHFTMKSDMGEMPMDILISDYKKVGEQLMLPHKTKMSLMTQEITTTFDKIEINVEVPESRFELPAEIKELQAKKDKKAAEPATGDQPKKTPDQK